MYMRLLYAVYIDESVLELVKQNSNMYNLCVRWTDKLCNSRYMSMFIWLTKQILYAS